MVKNNLISVRPVLPANNIGAEIDFFARLGFLVIYDSLQYSDKLDYAVLHREGIIIHIQFQFLDDLPSENFAQTLRIIVHNLDALHDEFIANGFEIEYRDNTPWGTNEFGFYSPVK